MRCPGLADLPAPPPGRTGWPWTEKTPLLGDPPTGASWPTLSIVTPSYNQGMYIEETIRSVLLQGYPNIEYILIDGGSTDETVAIIRKYERYLTHWCSEKDRGQYHAINKGLARCTGEVFNWINSDDLLCPGALAAVAKAWIREPGHIVAGRVVDFQEDGTEEVFVPSEISVRNLIIPSDSKRRRSVFHQPGTFLPLAAVKKTDGLREDLDYVSDRILMIELSKKCSAVHIEEQLARFRLHGSSKTVSMGHAEFELEFVRSLETIPAIDDVLTPRIMRKLRARACLVRTRVEVRRGQFRMALGHVFGALRISIPATMVLLGRHAMLGIRRMWARRAGDER